MSLTRDEQMEKMELALSKSDYEFHEDTLRLIDALNAAGYCIAKIEPERKGAQSEVATMLASFREASCAIGQDYLMSPVLMLNLLELMQAIIADREGR
jgi:hypothetical protein